MVDWVPKNDCHQCLCPQGEPQLPPASLEGSLRSESRSDPGSFQIMASVLGLEACEILYLPFSWSPFPTALQVFPIQAPLAFKVQRAGGSSSQCRTPGLRSPMWGLDPSLLGENLCDFDYPPVCRSPTWECGSWLYCISAPPTHFIVVPSLYLCTNLAFK